jgi:3-hydroxy-D-aspartate aldolase
VIRPPATVGMSAKDIDTPALVVELDAFERNLHKMQAAVGSKNIQLRPHSKTHKSTDIARRQISLGAVGVCCQKTSEAEIMVEGGVQDVLIANEVVGEGKVQRVADLAKRAKVAVCVDRDESVREFEAAAAKSSSTLRVLVELNVGANRCGVESPADVLRIARSIAASGHLSFGGIQAYHGGAQHIRAYVDREAAIARAVRGVKETRALLAANGLPCECVTGAGTGSFQLEMASGVYNEVQAGSYIFMDRDYRLNRDAAGKFISDFENSLFILTTIMSHATPERMVVDAGLKSFSVDSGMPELADHPGWTVERASDEHGLIDLSNRVASFTVGEKIRLVPGHCDPTVNLHDWLVCVRDDRVESLWPVSARGAVF